MEDIEEHCCVLEAKVVALTNAYSGVHMCACFVVLWLCGRTVKLYYHIHHDPHICHRNLINIIKTPSKGDFS
jgi:hypothetical protein